MEKEEIANRWHLGRDLKDMRAGRCLEDSPGGATAGPIPLGWEYVGCAQGAVRSLVRTEQLREGG